MVERPSGFPESKSAQRPQVGFGRRFVSTYDARCLVDKRDARAALGARPYIAYTRPPTWGPAGSRLRKIPSSRQNRTSAPRKQTPKTFYT